MYASCYLSSCVSSYCNASNIPLDRCLLDRLAYFISSVYLLRFLNKSSEKNVHSYISLSSKMLENVFGARHYKLIMNIALNTVIEHNDYYRYISPRNRKRLNISEEKAKEYGRCRGYRFKKQFRDLIEDGIIKFEKVTTSLNLKKTNIPLNDEKLKYIEEILKNRTTFDFPSIEQIINEIKVEKETDKESLKHLLREIKEQNFGICRGKCSHRLYNYVINLPKKCRQYIKIDGENLYEVDISGSQPLLLNLLYDKESRESIRFKEITESGKFYDFFLNGLDYGFPESNFKINMLVFLFDGWVRPWQKGIEYTFKLYFPILYDKIQKIKEGNYKKLAWKLQQAEAKIMIDGVLSKCMEQKIPILTIHDSILCKKQDIKRISDIILSEFKKVNLVPNLKIK